MMASSSEVSLPYVALAHADWSVNPKKRWVARARFADGWRITSVEPVGPVKQFVRDLIGAAERGPTLAGFDFPIGVPSGYGERTGLPDFRHLLAQIGTGKWSAFASVARDPSEISIERPFYPAGAQAGLKQSDLLMAHSATSLDDIRRRCERATDGRRAACPLFWTLGGNQVGRGALSGWQEVLKPALDAGARLWPFDGSLAALGSTPSLVLAETYPAEAYHHIGVSFGARQSKTSQPDRQSQAGAILSWASRSHVTIASDVEAEIEAGFGDARDGEDRFDAFVGLAGMIEVVSGRRPADARQDDPWEGWILGQTDA